MTEALALARRGVALASPNPCVGAIVVDRDGNVAGRGFHTYEGIKHAEVLALEEAGSRARGGTLYLNLEPCFQQGRTGPCVERVIAGEVRRVVVAMEDPNPLVAGRSLANLRAAGIEVVAGVLQEPARKLNEAFARHILTGQPLVTLKAGMTLDGKIAPPPPPARKQRRGPPQPRRPVESENLSAPGAGGTTGGWITSADARLHVQELRHASDAIMVGVGTIMADDPLLTDRTGEPRRRPLLRVILDSRLRLPEDSRVVQTVHDDVLVFCSFAEEKKRKDLEARGVRVEQLPLGGADGRPSLREVARRLGKMDVISVLIEGGALVNGAALDAGIVDKVFLYYAPKILAGTGSVPFAAGAGFRRMSEAAQVHSLSLHRFGTDFAVEGYLRDPYAPPSALLAPVVPLPTPPEPPPKDIA